MIRFKHIRGFTLIELMLAMSFVSVLLIAIALTTMQVIHIYTKGITLREVNQIGRTISDDLQRTIGMTAPFKVDPANQSDSKYITARGGGRLCVGAYTYAWNYGKAYELGGSDSTLNVKNKYSNSGDIIRLVKVSDPNGTLCVSQSQGIDVGKAKELLIAGDRNLAVQDFTVTAGATDPASGQALYAISFSLGSNDRKQLTVTQDDTLCAAPSQGTGVTGDDFCAVNRFDIVVRAGNRAGGQ